MGEFEIACRKISGWADKIDSCSKEIKRQEIRAAELSSQMRHQEGSYHAVAQALSGISEDLHRQQEQMKQYGDMLETIAKAYESTEMEIQNSKEAGIGDTV